MEIRRRWPGYWATYTDNILTQNDVEGYIAGYIANEATDNYVPRYNATKLETGTIYDNGTEVGIGTASPAGRLDVGGGDLVVDPNGRVGIGTTIPESRLEVNGTVKATAFAGDGSALTGISGPSQWSDSIGGIYYNGGNVGIGTMSPDTCLHLYSSTLDPFTFLHIEKTRQSGPHYYFRINADQFEIIKDNSINFCLTGDGKVGVGIQFPFYKLHVNGTAYATGAAGALSDYRHKANISNIAFDALEVVNQTASVF